ncbi:kinase suppressor of Ras 1-like isoform X2 [Apostichopus japonicus]|uniref:kinase suppressor of Ras 1-like isoform X2 n=1 Tax=Stichopus japonicus TaxID=307972 RepID=UPI003AB2EE55
MEKQDSRRNFLEFIRENCLKRESHCYSRKIVTSKKCDFCQKSLFLVALRCKGCRQNYHRKCASHAPATCFVAAPKIPNGDALQSTDQLVTRDRRVPVSGERVDEFLAGTGSGAIGRKINCGRSHSDTRKPGSISAAPTRSEGCLSTAANRLETPCNHGGMLSPGVDSVFYEDHRMLFCGVDQPEHSNHSSLSQGYGSLSESETCCWQAESDSPSIRTRSVSSVTMRAEDRRKVWSKTSSKVQTLDTVSPAKGTNRRDRATTDASFSRTGTWPTDPYCHGVQDDVCDEIEDRVQEWLKGADNEESSAISARERLKEWTISYSDFKFGECVRKGRDRALYRGHWHGEVLIHTRTNAENLEHFLDEVAMLSMVRHENIALFMGACIDEPHLAIITSIHKGPSLYKRIHVECGKMSLSSRVNVARQIAQGMSYLHAKDIMVPHLSSRTVFLEAKVKIDMMGDAHCLTDEYERPNYACLQKGEIQYLPPETLRGAAVHPPNLKYNNAKTPASDVFAFGTILFELLAGRFPFQKECLETIVYKVGKGQRASLDGVRCPPAIKKVHEDCWTLKPEGRPSFSSILARLSQNVALVNRRHSLSEADLKGRSRPSWISS